MRFLGRLVMWAVLLAAAGGAIAVAVMELPPPTRQIEQPATLRGSAQ